MNRRNRNRRRPEPRQETWWETALGGLCLALALIVFYALLVMFLPIHH